MQQTLRKITNKRMCQSPRRGKGKSKACSINVNIVEFEAKKKLNGAKKITYCDHMSDLQNRYRSCSGHELYPLDNSIIYAKNGRIWEEKDYKSKGGHGF